MDWEKVGQAFQGGANVFAGGLMDKYQRQKDLQDWEQKQRLASQIQTGEREAEHTFQIGKQTREAWLESIKQDFKTNPELVPFALRAEQGDEEAQKVLSLYAGARHQMDQKIPLSPEQISELQGLPPQTRHTIINRHLTTLNEETKRQADLKRTEAETKYREAMAKKAEEDLRRGTTEKADTEAAKIIAGNTKDTEERIAAREKKRAAVQQLETNILTLQGRVGDKEREQSVAKDPAKPGIQKVINSLKAEQGQLLQQKDRLEKDLQREADILKKKRPDLFPEEEPANVGGEEIGETIPPELQYLMAGEAPPRPKRTEGGKAVWGEDTEEEWEAQVKLYRQLAAKYGPQWGKPFSDEEREEIYRAMAARPDVTQEVIIRAYIQYKRQKNPVAPPPGRRW